MVQHLGHRVLKDSVVLIDLFVKHTHLLSGLISGWMCMYICGSSADTWQKVQCENHHVVLYGKDSFYCNTARE